MHPMRNVMPDVKSGLQRLFHPVVTNEVPVNRRPTAHQRQPRAEFLEFGDDGFILMVEPTGNRMGDFFRTI